MFKVEILPLALEDITSIAIWYNEQQKGLGLRFAKTLRYDTRKIQKNPNAFVKRYKKIHTYVMSDFPFLIHYFIEENQKKIIISAVFHTSLNPEKWNERT